MVWEREVMLYRFTGMRKVSALVWYSFHMFHSKNRNCLLYHAYYINRYKCIFKTHRSYLPIQNCIKWFLILCDSFRSCTSLYYKFLGSWRNRSTLYSMLHLFKRWFLLNFYFLTKNKLHRYDKAVRAHRIEYHPEWTGPSKLLNLQNRYCLQLSNDN